MFRQRSRRDQLFRQALRREDRSAKKSIDRGEGFRTAFPYGLFFLWGTFLGVTGYVIGFSSLLDVTEVTVIGSERVPAARILDTAETMLDEKQLAVFSQRNYLFVPEARLVRTLLDAYPLLQSVEIVSRFPNRLSITVTERPYLSLWCSGGPCVLLDADQKARSNEQLSYAAYDAWRLRVIDTSALPVVLGEVLDVGRYLEYFAVLYRSLPAELGLTVQQDAFTASRFSGELRLTTDRGWTLLVSVEVPVEETLAALGIFLNERTKGANKDVPLMTIDIRVPGRIFFSEKRPDTGEESALQEASDEMVPSEEGDKQKKKKDTRN